MIWSKGTSNLIEVSSQFGVRRLLITSYSPHFGFFMRGNHQVIELYYLTYKEYLTILTQIEVVVNSRPLLATTTDDSADILYISPRHF